MDYSALTAAIDFAGPLAFIAATGAALAVVYVGITGLRLGLGFLRGRG